MLAGGKAVYESGAFRDAMQHEADLSGPTGLHMLQEFGRFEGDRLALLGASEGKPEQPFSQAIWPWCVLRQEYGAQRDWAVHLRWWRRVSHL